MKIIWSAVLAAFIFGGCSSAQNSETIAKIVDGCTNSDIVLKDVKGRKRADGFMEAQITGENHSKDYQSLKYRVVWMDKDGFVIETIMSNWAKVPAYENQPFAISAVSPNAKASTFRVYIKREEEILCNKQSN